MSDNPKNLPSAADIIELIERESWYCNSHGDHVRRPAIANLLTKVKGLEPAAPSPEEVKTHQESVTDNALIEFAEQEQFLLFCDRDEFVDIARSVLQRFGKSPAPDVSEVEKARRTADYWKAEHLAGNERIKQLEKELEDIEEWTKSWATTDHPVHVTARAALSAYKESDK